MKKIYIFLILFVVYFIGFLVADELIPRKRPGFDFCEEKTDWDNDGIPDRMDSCVCKEEFFCQNHTVRRECMKERNLELCGWD